MTTLGYKHTEEAKRKQSENNKGKHSFKHTSESLEKISEASKKQKGKPSPFKGKTYAEIGRGPSPTKGQVRSDAFKKKISEINLKRLGLTEASPARDGNQNQKWKLSVKKRDQYTCQGCGIHQKDLKKTGNQVLDYLHSHHIKSWKEFPELRFDVTNCITYCWPCHLKAENKQITVPDSMPLPEKKKQIPWNKGMKLPSPLINKSEEEIKQFSLHSKVFNLIFQALGGSGRKGGRPEGLPAWNKGKTNKEIYGEEKAAELSMIAADNARRCRNRLGKSSN